MVVGTGGANPGIVLGTNPGTNRCPACWSALGPDDERCAECGHSIHASKGRWQLPIAALTLAGVGAVVWWGLLDDNRPAMPEQAVPQDQPSRTAERPAEPVPGIGSETRQTELAPATHVLWVRGNEGPVPLLRVASAEPTAGALLCLPLDLVPRRGPLTTKNGDELHPEVVTVEWERGLVLLQAPASAVGGTVALPVGMAANLTPGDPIEVWDPRRIAKTSIQLTAPLGGAVELKLAAPLPVGAVLVFHAKAVAYGVGGIRALPLDPLLPWLRHGTTTHATTLADLQKQVRSRDPQLILEDVGALLAHRPPTMKHVEDALAMLESGQHLARDASTIQAFARLGAMAHQQRVRLLSPIDPVHALVLAKEAMLRFPDHGGILADVVLLSLGHGDAAEAAGFYEQLLRVSSAHAKSIADEVATGLLKVAGTRRRARLHQEALALLARGTQLFPERADLHLAYAQALAAVGRDHDALAQASEAARLDPSYATQLDRYQRAAAYGNEHHQRGRYVIPYDPKTRILKARASVGNQSMRFLVDTGASLTTVPTALADRLGLRRKNNPRTKVTTASGVMEVEIVELPSLRLGRIRLGKVQAAVLDLPGESLGGTGLLGLNVLQRLDMEIDSENSRLILKQPRNGR